MIEPMATTVATLDPETAANSAEAVTPAKPRPPGQCPTSEVVKSIIRLATPPCVRNVPARIKNGIAMIVKLSRPVNSLRPTLSIGTCVMVTRNDSTVRPSAMEIGMPVSISATSRPKMMAALNGVSRLERFGDVRHALDVLDVVVRQLSAAPKIIGCL